MISVEIKGLKETIDKLKKFGDQGYKTIEDVTGQVANEMVGVAKREAARHIDTGKLTQTISLAQEIADRQAGKISYSVIANEKYAPYVEFGTGDTVDIQPGWEDMAGQFIGKKIKKINLPARPFMFPAYLHGKKIYKQDLEDSLNALIKQNE